MIKRMLEQSAVRRKVLRVLVEHPGTRFSITILAVQAKCSRSGVQKEMEVLVPEEIVLRVKEANRFYYEINTAHKHHKEIKGHLAEWIEAEPAAKTRRRRGRPPKNYLRTVEGERDRLRGEAGRLTGELAKAQNEIRSAAELVKERSREAVAGSKREKAQTRRIAELEAALAERDTQWKSYAEGLAKDRTTALEQVQALKERLSSVEARLEVTRDALARAQPAPKRGPSGEELRTLICAHCSKNVKVKVAWSGQTKQCPHCAHIFQVPGFA